MTEVGVSSLSLTFVKNTEDCYNSFYDAGRVLSLKPPRPRLHAYVRRQCMMRLFRSQVGVVLHRQLRHP